MRNLNRGNSDPWLLGSDFNEILRAEEKRDGRENFNTCMISGMPLRIVICQRSVSHVNRYTWSSLRTRDENMV